MIKEEAVKIHDFPVKLYGTSKDEENLEEMKATFVAWRNVYPDHMILEINYSEGKLYMYLDFMTSVEGYYEIEGLVYSVFERPVTNK